MATATFSPAFGNRPSQLVGRNEVLARIEEGLGSPPHEQARILNKIISGNGFGKDSQVLNYACGIGTQALA